MPQEPAERPDPAATGPQPALVRHPADLARELQKLRQRAARGSGRGRVTLEQIARTTGIPRSTVHSYVSGTRLPPSDALDTIVVALGATAAEQAEWARALERASDPPPTRPRSEAADHTGVPHQLPAGPAGFVGREQELATLSAAARTAEQAAPVVLAVTGIGGVGKTALVLHWAHRSTAHFPDGELWVDLRGFSAAAPLGPADALERLLRAVGVGTAELPHEVDARAAMFRSAVAGKRMLLVVDNARDSEHVRPLLPGTPGFVTVVTSRDALRSLVAREGAARIKVEPLELAAAVALLSGGLPEAASRALSPERIAVRCDGLPLALRIVRERLSSAHESELARLAGELEGDREDRLAAFDVHDASSELSVRAVMEWSYRSLPADAAAALRRLPLCRVPTFDLDVVRVVLDVDPPTARRRLEILVSANLLDVAGPELYRVHDLVAAYAADRLATEEPAEAVGEARIRLLEYLTSSVEAVLAAGDRTRPIRLARPEPERADLRGEVEPFPDSPTARDWMATHTDMVLAAVLDAAEQGPAEYSWALAERAWRALWFFGNVDVMEPGVRAMLNAARRTGAVAPQWMACRLLAITYAQNGRMAEAERGFEEAVALATGHGDLTAARNDTANLAFVRAIVGDLDWAAEALRRAIAESEDGSVDQYPSLTSLIELELQRGDLSAVRALTARALEFPVVKARSGSFYLETEALQGCLELDSGDLPAARRRFTDLARASREVGNDQTLSHALERLAMVHHGMRERRMAAALARQAADAARAAGSRSREIDADATLGEILRDSGRPAEALQLCADALARARQAEIKYAECRTLIFIARALRDLGDVPASAAEAATALEIAERCGYRRLGEEAAELVAELAAGETG